MAKNTTATGSAVEGSTFVHPDNMGNTLVFKDKVYNVNVGDTLTVGENGLVEVNLSPDSGNLLEARDNGLYYGVTPVVSSYYVSNSTGSDSNTGTKALPFKTLKAAFAKIKPNQRTTIYLDENDTHEWRSSWGVLADNTCFVITPYGDTSTYVEAEKDLFSVSNVRSEQLRRPTLKLIADRPDNGFINASIMSTSENMSELNGVKLVLEAPQTGLVTSTQFFGQGGGGVDLWLRGCEITADEFVPLLRVGRNTNVVFDHCKLANNNKLIHVETNGLLTLGFRFIYDSEITKGTPVVGNKAGGVPTTLTYNGADAKNAFLQVLSGKTTAQQVGVIY